MPTQFLCCFLIGDFWIGSLCLNWNIYQSASLYRTWMVLAIYFYFGLVRTSCYKCKLSFKWQCNFYCFFMLNSKGNASTLLLFLSIAYYDMNFGGLELIVGELFTCFELLSIIRRCFNMEVMTWIENCCNCYLDCRFLNGVWLVKWVLKCY